uniref:Uncharacterized protein n=1 Tax=Rangifer tarandus platyrhynchus TaxID=3082113 RepID=A0ACB0DY96_RANTA|nr:unnamed protein product [Rangifer tarandus platyrhynchus]
MLTNDSTQMGDPGSLKGSEWRGPGVREPLRSPVLYWKHDLGPELERLRGAGMSGPPRGRPGPAAGWGSASAAAVEDSSSQQAPLPRPRRVAAMPAGTRSAVCSSKKEPRDRGLLPLPGPDTATLAPQPAASSQASSGSGSTRFCGR